MVDNNYSLTILGTPNTFETYSDGVISFIVGVSIIGGLLVTMVVSLIYLCVIKRKRRSVICEYSQVETDGDSETIPLKTLSGETTNMRYIKPKKNKKKIEFPEKRFLTEKFPLDDGYIKNIYSQRDYLVGMNNSILLDKTKSNVPIGENKYIPMTVSIPIQLTQSFTGIKTCISLPGQVEFISENPIQPPPAKIVHVVPESPEKPSIIKGMVEETATEKTDCTLTFPFEDNDDNQNAIPSKLPSVFPVPLEITDSNDPTRGLLAFSLSLRRLSNEADPVSLLVHIFEARCILTEQIRQNAWFGVGKFYVKARLHSTDVKLSACTGSMASLDQSILSHSIFPHLNSNNNSSTSGRTKAKCACRTIRFLETIELPFPKPWRKLVSADKNFSQREKNSTSNCTRKRSISISELDVKPFELRLCLTLKQLESSGKAVVLKRLNRHLAGKSEVGTVTLPCPPSLLEMIDAGSTSSGHTAPQCTTLKPFLNRDLVTAQVSQPGLLRIVQEISPLVNSSPGLINLALQWNARTKTISCRAIDCFSVAIPLGTKHLFVSYSLMTNTEVLNVINSKPSVKHSLTACEFLLTDTVQFPLSEIEGGVDSICLGVALVVALRGLKNSEMLLGRVVLGPDGLAYGSGLRHWCDVTRKPCMIRRSHWFT